MPFSELLVYIELCMGSYCGNFSMLPEWAARIGCQGGLPASLVCFISSSVIVFDKGFWSC